MTTAQAIAYAILRGFTEFLPIGAGAHTSALAYFTSWPEPEGAISGALALGAVLSLLVYFRHDWASMGSCFLQVLIYRKKPMTLDERMPIFLAIGLLPIAAGWYYLHPLVAEIHWSAPLLAATTAAFGIPLWLTESFSRKNKGNFDWNWLDALVVGITGIASLVPGCGRPAAELPGAMMRNYTREAGAKFSLYLAAPILAASAFMRLREVDFHAAMPMDDTSWLSFWIAMVVTFVFGLLGIGAFMRGVQGKGFRQYTVYRFVLAAGIGLAFFLKTRGV